MTASRTAQQVNMDDHDLLIQLNTKMDSVLESLHGIPDMQKAISQNAQDIAVCKNSEAAIKEDIGDLQKKSNRWDSINSILVVIGTIIGFKFGN